MTRPQPKSRLDAYYDSIVEIERERLAGTMPVDELEAELAAFRERVANDSFLPELIKHRWAQQAWD